MILHKHLFQAIVAFPSIVLENILIFFGNIWKAEKEEFTSDIEFDPEADVN